MSSYEVDARSIANISGVANKFLLHISSNYLNSLHAFDLAKFIEFEMASKIGVEIAIKDLSGGEMAHYRPVEGVITLDEEKTYRPLHSRQDQLHTRARFTVAHELGHAVLHRKILREYATIDKEKLKVARVIAVPPYRQAEWQANMFASFVLAPTPFMKTIMKHNGSKAERDIIAIIAKLFDVSEAVAMKRLATYKKHKC